MGYSVVIDDDLVELHKEVERLREELLSYNAMRMDRDEREEFWLKSDRKKRLEREMLSIIRREIMSLPWM